MNDKLKQLMTDDEIQSSWTNDASIKSNLFAFMGVIIMMSLMYLLLLGPEHTVFSLSTLLDWIVKLTPLEQLFAVSLVPIYLSILIFGGSVLGGFLGYRLQRHYIRRKIRGGLSV